MILRRLSSSIATSSVDSSAFNPKPSISKLTDKNAYQPVIGLEIHVQLNTRTKLFSRSPNFEASPNRLVSPFDMATPATMPALNKQCVLHALKMGFLMNCEIPKFSRFDRKHYFYADMPAGYQITQNKNPIAKNGKFWFYVFDDTIEPYWKQVEILQLQLEQDSGKTIHIEKKSLVDYNRAGCALVEVVTSPCFSTALEAICFVQHLRLTLMNYNLCDGELHKGQIRVDANVSLSFEGNTGVRTEIKNMNSIRTIRTAINYEIARQFDILSNGRRVLNETRAADSIGRTVSMRDKEEETDYRFISEPNIPTLFIRPEWLNTCEEEIKNAGKPKFEWLRDDIGFDPRSSIHIEDPLLCGFVEKCVKLRENDEFVNSSSIITWMKELKTIMQRSKFSFPPQSEFFIVQFVQLVDFYERNRITRLRMLDLLRLYASNEEVRAVLELIDDNGFWMIKDENAIEKIVRGCLEDEKHSKIAEKYRSGNSKAFNKMRNIILDKSKKRIEVEQVETVLRRLLQ